MGKLLAIIAGRVGSPTTGPYNPTSSTMGQERQDPFAALRGAILEAVERAERDAKDQAEGIIQRAETEARAVRRQSEQHASEVEQYLRSLRAQIDQAIEGLVTFRGQLGEGESYVPPEAPQPSYQQPTPYAEVSPPAAPGPAEPQPVAESPPVQSDQTAPSAWQPTDQPSQEPAPAFSSAPESEPTPVYAATQESAVEPTPEPEDRPHGASIPAEPAPDPSLETLAFFGGARPSTDADAPTSSPEPPRPLLSGSWRAELHQPELRDTWPAEDGRPPAIDREEADGADDDEPATSPQDTLRALRAALEALGHARPGEAATPRDQPRE